MINPDISLTQEVREFDTGKSCFGGCVRVVPLGRYKTSNNLHV